MGDPNPYVIPPYLGPVGFYSIMQVVYAKRLPIFEERPFPPTHCHLDQVAALFPEAQMERKKDGSVMGLEMAGFNVLAGLDTMDLDPHMAARRTRHEIAGAEVAVIPPEDNPLLKAKLGRGSELGKHDWEDIEAMMANLPTLDWKYLYWRADSCLPPQLAGGTQSPQGDMASAEQTRGGKATDRVKDFGGTQHVEITVLGVVGTAYVL